MAGYPEAHPDTVIDGDDAHNEKSYWENIAYLKEKVGLSVCLQIIQCASAMHLEQTRKRKQAHDMACIELSCIRVWLLLQELQGINRRCGLGTCNAFF